MPLPVISTLVSIAGTHAFPCCEILCPCVDGCRCGRRGGYAEFVGFDDDVLGQLYKLASISLCSNVSGQVMVRNATSLLMGLSLCTVVSFLALVAF